MSQKKDIRQASQIWSALDNLAQTDPVKYRTFIKEQIEQGQKMTSPPKPDLLIHITTRDVKYRSIYVLMCSWSRLPAPVKDDDPLNVIGGEPYKVTDEKSKKTPETMLYPLAFSDDTIEKYGSSATNNEAQLTLIDMAIEYLKKERRLCVDSDAMYEICSEKYIGTIDSVHRAFNYKPFDPETEFKENFGDLTANKDIKLTKDDEPLEEELMELRITKEEQKKPSNKVLIEEVCVPRISVNEQRGQLTIEIPLEGVRSMAEVELDIAETVCHLEIPTLTTYKPVHLTLPRSIDTTTATARFHRKLSKLIIVARLK